MRAAFYTLGCKVNQYETQILMQQFSADGFDIVTPEEEADIYVVNSCTVTSTGDKKTRQVLRCCGFGANRLLFPGLPPGSRQPAAGGKYFYRHRQ